MRPVCILSAKCRQNVWHPVLISAIVALPLPSVAESTRTVGTAKFIGANERTHRFSQPITQDGCRTISENLGICLEGTGYVLADSIADGRDRIELYEQSDRHQAAVTSVFFPFKEALEMSPEALDTLIDKHLYEQAPGGPRTVDRTVYERRSESGYLSGGAADVTTQDDEKMLVLYTIFRQQYGVGIVETTTFSKDPAARGVINLDEAEQRHEAFLEATRVKVNVGPGY